MKVTNEMYEVAEIAFNNKAHEPRTMEEDCIRAALDAAFALALVLEPTPEERVTVEVGAGGFYSVYKIDEKIGYPAKVVEALVVSLAKEWAVYAAKYGSEQYAKGRADRDDEISVVRKELAGIISINHSAAEEVRAVREENERLKQQAVAHGGEVLNERIFKSIAR
jgi:hypothetical protein